MRTLLLLALVACGQRNDASDAASVPNYELDCAPSNTATAAQLQCARTDTRTGDVLVVDYARLPTSSGPTANGAVAPGRFTTRCEAPSTGTRADFYCVRMNTETGELLLVNLSKVGVIPPRAQ